MQLMLVVAAACLLLCLQVQRQPQRFSAAAAPAGASSARLDSAARCCAASCSMVHGGIAHALRCPPRVVRRRLRCIRTPGGGAGSRCPVGAESPEHDSSGGAAQASAVLAARHLARPTLRLASARRSDQRATLGKLETLARELSDETRRMSTAQATSGMMRTRSHQQHARGRPDSLVLRE